MKKRVRTARRNRIVLYASLALAMFFAVFLMVAAYRNKPDIPAVAGILQKFDAQDGDSLVAASGRHIRLLCIDAPEMQQRHGVKARDFLAALVKDGARIRSGGKDQYGRTLAIVIVTIGGKEIIANYEMLRQGHAWVYRRFSDDCGLPEKMLLEMEKQARAASRGLWQNKNPIPPWKWRQKNR